MKRAPYERKHSKTRISIHALTADQPKQSISFTEGWRTSASPSSANASSYLFPTSALTTPGLLDFKDSSGSLMDSQVSYVKSPAAERSSRAAAEGPDTQSAQTSGPPTLQPVPGVRFCHVVSSCGSICPSGQSLSALDLDAGRADGEHRTAGKNDNGEDDFTTGLFHPSGEHWCDRQCRGGGPVFTLTNTQLQVSEEFIDDDPADISFFAGGSEAFSFPYSSLISQEPRVPAQPTASPPLCGPDAFRHPESAQSSPDRYSTEAVDMNVEDDFEFEEESDFNGNVHPSDTSELFEVKAQASLMQSLLSPSETSSLRNNQSENSSLNNMPLHGGLSSHMSSSANQSEASSMVNFPAYSVRSESSSAFQFSDIIDQLEQLSYPPTTAEDSSSTDTDSWDSEAEAPLDVSLFFSNSFAQTSGERVTFDLQNNLKNLTPGEQIDKNPS
ncbi:PREDICTED: uncharacterized serine-rich protein C215.13-like [Galeopterus variegatus]|nr:PREDICTED: uncharacterized serine-rich protein C215.13-like [Galeopterus variegatus]